MSANVRSAQPTLRDVGNRTSRTSAAIEEAVRRRAYRLYVEGGRREGHAKEDWLRAEREVLGMACRGGTREDAAAP
jgi:Protein of unknown function (DUF2934)